MRLISRSIGAGLLAGSLLILPAGVAAHDGSPHSVLWRNWHLPTLIVLLIPVLIYLRGILIVRGRTGSHYGAAWWQAGCFSSGLLALTAALASPIEALSSHFFWVHMVQHLLLIVVAAPLLILSNPVIPMLWAVPRSWRLGLAGLQHHLAVRGMWGWLAAPLIALGLHIAVIWMWHLPSAYQVALRSDVLHIIEHLLFLGAALLYWWVLLHPTTRADYGFNILSLFALVVANGLLGVLLTFARTPWYSYYVTAASGTGLSPLEDQQLAGLMMWIPPSIIYLAAGAGLILRWIERSESASYLSKLSNSR